MSHLAYHNTSSNPVASLEALIASYTMRMRDFRELAARIDGAALCTQMLRDLETLRAEVSAALANGTAQGRVTTRPVSDSADRRDVPVPGTPSEAVVSPAAAGKPPVAQAEPMVQPAARPDLTIHRQRAAASLRAVEPPPGERYDPIADARSTAALLRASKRRTQ